MKHLTIVFVGAMIFSYSVNAEPYLEKVLPDGVKIGMTAAELRMSRKEMFNGPHVEGSGVNLIERLGRLTFGWYYIRNDKLAGYMRTTRRSLLDTNQSATEEALITPSKSYSFALIGSSKAARSTKELKMEEIEVLNWKSNDSDLQLFTVNTSNELTVIVFEPTRLSWKDFFVGTEIRGPLEASRKSIEKILDKTNAQSGKEAPKTVASRDTQSVTAVIPASTKVAAETSPIDIRWGIIIVIAALAAGTVLFFIRRKP